MALSGPIKHQFLDNNGDPLAFGKLYSFAAGSSTPLDTYTTYLMNVANPNPIILDASGRVPLSSGIYLAPASYKFELTTAANTSLWTQDQITDIGKLVSDAVTAGLAPILPSVTTITTTGTQTALAIPTGTGDLVIYANNATLLTVQGIVAGTTGQRLTIISKGAGQVDYAHLHASGTALGKLHLFATTGLTSLAAGSGTSDFVYDLALTKWRLVSHQQGAWITPAFTAADYTAATGTWTVDAGDVITAKYYLNGRALQVVVRVATSDVSATPATLNRIIPGGFTATNTSTGTNLVINAGAAAAVGANSIQAGATSLLFYATAALGAWSTTAADNTLVDFDRTFEVN